MLTGHHRMIIIYHLMLITSACLPSPHAYHLMLIKSACSLPASSSHHDRRHRTITIPIYPHRLIYSSPTHAYHPSTPSVNSSYLLSRISPSLESKILPPLKPITKTQQNFKNASNSPSPPRDMWSPRTRSLEFTLLNTCTCSPSNYPPPPVYDWWWSIHSSPQGRWDVAAIPKKSTLARGGHGRKSDAVTVPRDGSNAAGVVVRSAAVSVEATRACGGGGGVDDGR